MSEESGFISGIFNYCDRWCERCPFVSRCRVGVAQQDLRGDPEKSDVRNAAFWEHLHEVFQQTKQLIVDMARDRGIDLDEAVAEAATRPRRQRVASAAHRGAIRQAKRYLDAVEAWFEANEQVFQRKGQDLTSAACMGLEGADPFADADDITDAVEVIRWYGPQIYVKLQRASRRDPEIDDDPELADSSQSDADGSTKVALIGMDRSIAAWGRLYDQLPDAQDGILDLLVQLDRLRRATEQLFPNARAFVRPGFDAPA
jgi:hypothetical protein